MRMFIIFYDNFYIFMRMFIIFYDNFYNFMRMFITFMIILWFIILNIYELKDFNNNFYLF